jgi:hypothetical protein
MGKIEVTNAETGAVHNLPGVILNTDWNAPDGKPVAKGVYKIGFELMKDGSRAIDWTVELQAAPGETGLIFGETKEGTMALRMHPKLRMDEDRGRGVKDVTGKAVNSDGTRDKNVWGKRAHWIAYWGEIEGKKLGFAMFDHPANPSFPTWWHARAYGLATANPFGAKDFGDKPTGAFVVPGQTKITFRYRIVLHEGDPVRFDIQRAWSDWAGLD